MLIGKGFFFYVLIFLSIFQSITISAESLPTSAPTQPGRIPVISDFDMQQCEKLYKESEKEYQDLLDMELDINDQKSLRKVRNQFNLHDNMVKQFNKNCAGKQSHSACEKTRKAHLDQGLSYQDCEVTIIQDEFKM